MTLFYYILGSFGLLYFVHRSRIRHWDNNRGSGDAAARWGDHLNWRKRQRFLGLALPSLFILAAIATLGLLDMGLNLMPTNEGLNFFIAGLILVYWIHYLDGRCPRCGDAMLFSQQSLRLPRFCGCCKIELDKGIASQSNLAEQGKESR